MSIQLTQRPNKIDISYSEEPRAIDIIYTGNFSVYVNGNTISSFNSTRMIIAFLEPPSDELLLYYGQLDIKELKAYNSDGKAISISYSTENDIIDNIRTDIDKMSSKIESYNRYKYYGSSIDPILSYSVNNEIKYINNKAQLIKEEDLKDNQKKILNRIRR